MKKTSLIAISIIAFALIGSIFIIGSKPKSEDSLPVENSEIRDGIQYVTINAGGGYSPALSSARAGVPTKLIVKTEGSYDCSSALAIHSLGYRKILPQTGETEIDIGIPEAGVPLQGVCSMGMYNFAVNFN